jgi:hypothetical protein
LLFKHFFASLSMKKLGFGHEHATSTKYGTPMRKVQAWQFNVVHLDVAPHIKFGPVANRKHTEVLTRIVTAQNNQQLRCRLAGSVPLESEP